MDTQTRPLEFSGDLPIRPWRPQRPRPRRRKCHWCRAIVLLYVATLVYAVIYALLTATSDAIGG